LKTTQVQPDMFEDMTRILIQNSQASGNFMSNFFIHELNIR